MGEVYQAGLYIVGKIIEQQGIRIVFTLRVYFGRAYIAK